VVSVTNWDSAQAETTVYYVPGGGFQNDARAVARQLNIAQPQVLASASPATDAALENANVLIVLGADTEG